MITKNIFSPNLSLFGRHCSKNKHILDVLFQSNRTCALVFYPPDCSVDETTLADEKDKRAYFGSLPKKWRKMFPGENYVIVVLLNCNFMVNVPRTEILELLYSIFFAYSPLKTFPKYYPVLSNLKRKSNEFSATAKGLTCCKKSVVQVTGMQQNDFTRI